MIVSLLVGCDTAVPVATNDQTYKGIVLPTARPIAAVPIEPPSAWIISHGTATPAASGGYCYQGACVDMTFPQDRADLPTISISDSANITIIINAPAVQNVSVRLGKWTTQRTALFDFPGMQEQTFERTIDEHVTVLTLAFPHNLQDAVVVVAVTFSGKGASGDASYIWRLNPAT